MSKRKVNQPLKKINRSKKPANPLGSKKNILQLKAPENEKFPIVALGASAGGLEAYQQFFSNIRNNLNMAYIVISHLDPTHISLLPELLKKSTNLQVSLITNGTRVRPNVIYVIPPKKNLSIRQGILYLSEQTLPHFSNLPINFFLESLAEYRQEQAVAVILSGSGTDGSLGLRSIKRENGLVIAQDPLTASYDSMPKNAINTRLVDFTLPPDAMADQLKKWSKLGKQTPGKLSSELQQIFIMLKARTGHDFSFYKLNTICRRIERQMYTHHINKISEYVSFLRTHPNEIDNLFKDLLIGVTNFFRDSEAFEHLKKDYLIKFFKQKNDDYFFRVWIPGCSTGEEVYTLAIILKECLEETKKHLNIQIFGTDIDLSALEKARTGVYRNNIVNDVTPERLKRFFIKENNNYRLKKEIREMVVFGSQNVIKDPPFTKLDLICCRNLLIYLSGDLQKKLLPIFHYSLKPKGLLFLGSSEAIAGYFDLFKLLAKKWKIFERKDTDQYPHILMNFPTISRITETSSTPFHLRSIMEDKNDITNPIKRFLLANYVPPCFVINKKGDILYTHGKMNHYFKVFLNENQTNLFKAIPPAFRKKMTAAVSKVLKKNVENIYHNVKFKLHNKTIHINFRVRPVQGLEKKQEAVCVIFDEITKSDQQAIRTKYNSINKMNKKIVELEHELQYSKENLQTMIEELQSSNEELQSSNEELQSTNEEIETSKEELQSLNEELVIVNTELQTRIDQLASVNDDMNNLFNNTQISAIFLDNDLKIKRFTPKAQELVHLIQNDIGRSISHFATNIKYEKLIDDAEEVLKTLIPKSFEVLSKDDKWYLIKILPYRTLTNVIDGVVITFTDITAHKEGERKLTELNNEVQRSLVVNEMLLDSVQEPLLVLTPDLKIIKANKAFCELYHLKLNQIVGKPFAELNKQQWNTPKLLKALNEAISKSAINAVNIEQKFDDGTLKPIEINIRPVLGPKIGTVIILTLKI